jgi:hypothetical protein
MVSSSISPRWKGQTFASPEVSSDPRRSRNRSPSQKWRRRRMPQSRVAEASVEAELAALEAELAALEAELAALGTELAALGTKLAALGTELVFPESGFAGFSISVMTVAGIRRAAVRDGLGAGTGDGSVDGDCDGDGDGSSDADGDGSSDSDGGGSSDGSSDGSGSLDLVRIPASGIAEMGAALEGESGNTKAPPVSREAAAGSPTKA